MRSLKCFEYVGNYSVDQSVSGIKTKSIRTTEIVFNAGNGDSFSDYQTDTLTDTLTGFSSGGVYVLDIVRVGTSVTGSFRQQTSGTKSGNSTATLTIPAFYRPTAATVGGIMKFTNGGGTAYIALWQLTTTGVFTIYGDLTGAPISDGAGAGFTNPASVCWVIN